MPSFTTTVLGTGLAAVIAASASASISVTYLGTGYGKFQQVSYNAGVQWDQAGSGPFYSTRAFDHHWQDNDTGGEFTAWCIQLYQGLVVGNTYAFDCVAIENAPQSPPAPGPMGTVQANVLRDLFARWADVSTGTVVPGGTLADTNAKAAAFSILIWEITHENFTGLTENDIKGQMSIATGGLRVNATADVAAWTATMQASLGTGGWLTSDLEGLISNTAQDQARLVPAPGVLALLGLAGVVGRRRRA